jgi:lipopolysaccharide biosynthesis glycosyltransferase
MKKPRIMFCPADASPAHLEQFATLEKSLRKFHSEEELPLIRVDNDKKDSIFWHRKTPVTAYELTKEYEVVIGIDCDEIITGSLEKLWEPGDWDVKVVLNDPTYPIAVWDIGSSTGTPYFNGGLIVMKEGKFLDHFYRLSQTEHIARYQFQEQDILNLLCSDYFDYTVDCLDYSDSIYGEFAKPVWAHATLEDDKIMISGKQLRVIHFGSGFNAPDKGNFRIKFSDEVSNHIAKLVK